jgi:alkylation response protein AidB-like acyl-CoA dehydrogenase
MQTAPAVTDEQFRQQFRAYLAAHHPGRRPRGRLEALQWQRSWTARLFDDGWAMPSWPHVWGGMDLSLTRQMIYHEEMARAGLVAQPTNNIGIVGPTLIRHGSPAQQERFLRRMARADDLWCQGFSEPEAGSDLLSLKTVAHREGDWYIVDGQKLWTSHADVADWMFALVRTGPPGSRQHGISYLLIDMRSEGIEVRPLRDITGGARFNEVFLDHVRVPAELRVGEENRGWSIARTSLGHERSTAHSAAALRYRRIVDELIHLARATGRTNDPVVRQRLAAAETDVRLVIWSGMRMMASVLATGDPGPASSASRLFYSIFEQRLHELALAILGPNGCLAPGEPAALEGGRWQWGFLSTRASTIGAGTAEIQRNTIAERLLGLPRDDLAYPTVVAHQGSR